MTERLRVSVFGDSNARCFYRAPGLVTAHQRAFSAIQASVDTIVGATILGLGRRTGHLRAQERIAARVAEMRPDFIILNFGQVDVELGYLYRRVVKEETTSFDDFAATLVASYRTSVEMLSGTAKVIVKGINSSALVAADNGRVDYLSRIVTENIAGEAEREACRSRLLPLLRPDLDQFAIHRGFNEALAGMCRSVGAGYYDLGGLIDDPATGRLRPEFAPAATDNHVVDSIAMRWLYWEPPLRMMGVL